MIWHSSNIKEIEAELMVDAKVGLSSAQIAGRIAKYGENKEYSKPKNNYANRMLKYVTVSLRIFFIIVAVITLIVNIITSEQGWYIPLIAILILGVNMVADVFLFGKTDKETAAIKGNIAPSARVLRDGEIKTIQASLLVKGDIVLLEQGDYIPADGRLIESYTLTCEESAVLGNSAPNEKNAEYILEDIADISKRKNMVYSGCSVVFGRGKMVVTDTGMNTEIARKAAISEIIQSNEFLIKKRLLKIGKMVNVGVLVAGFLIFILGVMGQISTENFSSMVFKMLLTATSISLAVVPLDSSRSVDLALGFGAHRILKSKVAVRKTDAIEKLGQVSVIISDKTGTLTKNRMKMTMLFDGSSLCELNIENPGENAQALIRTAALCTNSNLEILTSGKQNGVGDPTEIGIISALVEYCNLSKDDIENIYPRMAEVPFDSSRKLMTTINMINNKPYAIVKGSPDILMQLCTGGNLEGAAKATEEMSKRGLRAIAVAIKPLDEVPANANPENMECELRLLGVFGMTDSISCQTTGAIIESEGAGIRTIMITGDNIKAAEAIAKSLGILKQGQKAITGEDLEKMDDITLSEEIYNISVYSRISAKDKIRIVEAFKAKGETVAVTGDSIDDATVLKVADVGCAMGITGTDVAKGAADIVLTEDSYISIVKAIRESRGIYGNIKKIVSFVLSSAIGQLLAILSILIGVGSTALGTIPVLWLNLIVGLTLVMGIAAEGAGSTDMSTNPLPKKEPFFKGQYGISILWQGAMLGLLGIISYAIGGSAMAFAVLVLAEAFLAFGLRSNHSVINSDILKNKHILSGLGLAILSVIIIFATPLCLYFELGTLDIGILFLSLLFGVLPLIVLESFKFFKRYLAKNRF